MHTSAYLRSVSAALDLLPQAERSVIWQALPEDLRTELLEQGEEDARRQHAPSSDGSAGILG